MQFLVGHLYLNRAILKLLTIKKSHTSQTVLISACQTEYSIIEIFSCYEIFFNYAIRNGYQAAHCMNVP